MSNLTKLFTLFTTIEREYGIASLEKGEREILNLIVSAEEQKKEMSAEESPFMSEVLQLDLPHLVTMIHSGCNDIVPE